MNYILRLSEWYVHLWYECLIIKDYGLTRYVISWERWRLYLHLAILTLSVKAKHYSRLLNELRLDDAEKW